MKAFGAHTRSGPLRHAASFYMHRMIGSLGPAIGQYLPSIITLFLTDAGTNDLCDSVIIINQIMSTFKDNVFAVVDQLLMPLIEHIFKHIQVSFPAQDVTRHVVLVLGKVLFSASELPLTLALALSPAQPLPLARY